MLCNLLMQIFKIDIYCFTVTFGMALTVNATYLIIIVENTRQNLPFLHESALQTLYVVYINHVETICYFKVLN